MPETPRYTGPTSGPHARLDEAKRHVWPFSIQRDDEPQPTGDTFARGYWFDPEMLANIALAEAAVR